MQIPTRPHSAFLSLYTDLGLGLLKLLWVGMQGMCDPNLRPTPEDNGMLKKWEMSLKDRPMVMLTARIKVVTSLEEKTYNAQLSFWAFLGEISPWKTLYVFIKALSQAGLLSPSHLTSFTLICAPPSAHWVSFSLSRSLLEHSNCSQGLVSLLASLLAQMLLQIQ